MIKKSFLIPTFLGIALFIEIVFYHLTEEIRLPLLLTVLLLIILLICLEKSLFIPKKFSLFYGLFLVANIVSWLFSKTPFQATLELIKLLNYFGLIVAGINLWRINKKAFPQILIMLITAASFLALVGILEYSSRLPAEKLLPLFEPYHWPSTAANFFFLLTPAALYLFLKEKEKFKKIFLFVCLSLLAIAWILTRQYIGLLIFLLAVCCVIYFSKVVNKTEQESGKEIINILLLLLLLFVVLPNLSISFGTSSVPKEIALYQDQLYFQDKKDIARFAWESIGKHFFNGIGLANFGPAYRSNLVKPWTWSDYAGNELLHTFVEVGVMGFITQFILFTYLAYRLIRVIRQTISSGNIDITLALSLFFFLIININNFALRIFPLALIFFFLISYLLQDELSINISSKTSLFTLFFTLLITLFILSDGISLTIGQKQFVAKKNNQSAQILSWLSKRPAIILNPRVFIWLSALMVDKQNNSEALMYLYEAKKMKPYDKEINYQIALVYYQRGEKIRARNILLDEIGKNWYVAPKYYYTLAKLAEEEKNLPLSLFWLKRASFLFPININNQTNANILSILRYNNYLSSLSDIYFTLYISTKDKDYLDSLVMLAQ